MAPHDGEVLMSSHTISCKDFTMMPRLSNDNLHRTISDISSELMNGRIHDEVMKGILPPIHDVEDAKCECCGVSEECTLEFIERVREKFLGKWICGLCSEDVKEEMEKNGGKSQQALSTHMSHCIKFNRLGRDYPLLYQAEAMREILRRSSRATLKSLGPKDHKGGKFGDIARSSSCMPAITREMNGLALGD